MIGRIIDVVKGVFVLFFEVHLHHSVVYLAPVSLLLTVTVHRRLSHLQFCGGVLSALIRHDYTLPLPAIKIYVDGLIHDVLLFRRVGCMDALAFVC